jgi:hypothetical protein
MTLTELDRIESALGVKLPEFYRQFMQDYPRWLLSKQPAYLKPVTVWEFADNPERVIAFNQYVRAQPPGEFVDDAPWPDEYFVIGSEADQNWFTLHLASGTEAVHLYHHEDGEFHPVAQSLQEFTEYLVKWWEDIERDNQR